MGPRAATIASAGRTPFIFPAASRAATFGPAGRMRHAGRHFCITALEGNCINQELNSSVFFKAFSIIITPLAGKLNEELSILNGDSHGPCPYSARVAI